ncbi:MAG: 30S ribosomal protein S4 [Candidatus Dojkabacteria bacterium]|nr:30S ribosomal protein S4 [Candidatus Dojkabacteria bacterium]
MRYIGPKWRINRREGYTVLGKTDKWKRRSTLPGQFPVLLKKPSEYAYQFREKQKVKRMYGLNERQFKNLYRKAVKSRGNTGLVFLQLLEMRLDNIIYRLGFASTRAQARQFVTHGHVCVNGKRNNIPSSILKIGDEIILDDKILESPVVMENVQNKDIKNFVPSWLELSLKGGRVLSKPLRSHIDMSIRENLIIELYSKT